MINFLVLYNRRNLIILSLFIEKIIKNLNYYNTDASAPQTINL